MKKITIDPGTSGCGWAIWDGEWRLLIHGVFIPKRKSNEDVEFTDLEKWKSEADQVTIALYAIGWQCEEVYVEFPSAFGGGVAVQSGAVVKLATLVGMILGKFSCYTELVPVNDWKGQLPKDVVIRRIRKMLPGCKATTHDFDAIGIGLYKKGVF